MFIHNDSFVIEIKNKKFENQIFGLVGVCFYLSRTESIVTIKTSSSFLLRSFSHKNKQKLTITRLMLAEIFSLLLISVTGTTTITIIKSTASTITTTLDKQIIKIPIMFFFRGYTYEFWSSTSSTNFSLLIITATTVFLTTLIGW